MIKYARALAALLVFVFILSGCTVNGTQVIIKNLNPDELMKVYGNSPSNLAFRSKCTLPPSVNIVNMETRDQDLLIYEWWPTEVNITPKILMDGVVNYANNVFKMSGVQPDSKSKNIINLSLVNIKEWYTFFMFNVDVSIEIFIPENKYSAHYKYSETSGDASKVVPYAIHNVTWKIINDPVVQEYLLCR